MSLWLHLNQSFGCSVSKSWVAEWLFVRGISCQTANQWISVRGCSPVSSPLQSFPFLREDCPKWSCKSAHSWFWLRIIEYSFSWIVKLLMLTIREMKLVFRQGWGHGRGWFSVRRRRLWVAWRERSKALRVIARWWAWKNIIIVINYLVMCNISKIIQLNLKQ